MSEFRKHHLIIFDRTEALSYTSPKLGRSNLVLRQIGDRQNHGSGIKQQFNSAVSEFSDSNPDSDSVYVIFKSPLGFLLDLDKLDKGKFRLASYKILHNDDNNSESYPYCEATVYLNQRGISQFLRKIDEYLDASKDTPVRYNQDGSIRRGGNPRNLSLFANVEEVKAATLKSFWQEPELSFPNLDHDVWWEVWLSRSGNEEEQNPIDELKVLLDERIQIGEKVLKFPEHWICLLKGTARNLTSILYSNKLSELRKPRETADFFLGLDRPEQELWTQDLVNRVNNLSGQSSIAVCLLDTGVNRTHPLLINLIPEGNLDAVNPSWSKADTRSPFGHGTPMAGLIYFGDLSDVLQTNSQIQVFHHLESIKLLNDSSPHEPENFGAVTQEAISRGEILNPSFKRIVCLAVTATDIHHRGRPTSWSAALDQSLFGSVENINSKLLAFVSSGNVPFNDRMDYPLSNESSTIQDPAQSFNAITVGSYTLKDRIDNQLFPNSIPLAVRGDMSPSNSTSTGWWHKWCKKPDIVMEGGNLGIQNGSIIEPDSLTLLSISRGGVGRSLFTSFSDTSAATALASKLAAELYVEYPSFQPETIRALIVHSADWTNQMLGNRNISQLNSQEKERLFSKVGYGVPNLDKAKFSASNSLSMILERTLIPFKVEGSSIKTNEFHLFDMPWPRDVLLELSETLVKFKITLSYFIEPNPGNRQYDLAASYMSHGLRFKMIGPNESLERFKGRISRSLRDEDYSSESSEKWILGSQIRDKGSIHKDVWEGTAADLATRNRIAVYPIGGWWKSRRKLRRYDSSVKYSIIMTIETPSVDNDVYTSVENAISIRV